ncbi:hypothetical protein [Bacillus mycoides]|uniref:hypothetical protein n=1 Tax=Bacillus mycoides TaxID=1405 RepID=UPI003D65726F
MAGTTILICLVISSIIGESITGAIFLIQNIYDVIVGKEFHFSMRSFIIMFSIVFISGFNFINL